MPLNDVLRVKVFCSSGDQVAVNVRHYRISAVVPPEPSLGDFASTLNGSLGSLYVPLLSSGADYEGLAVQKISPLPVGSRIIPVAPPLTGTGGADEMPRQVSGIIAFRTALAGRRNRGRIYIPFPSEQRNDANARPTAQYVLDLASLAIFLVAPLTITVGLGSSTFTPVINHTTPPLGTIDIASYVARTVWATQRKRGAFGSPNPNIIL